MPVYQFAEKVIFRRLLKNAQMQGAPACGRQARSKGLWALCITPLQMYAATTKDEGCRRDE